MDTSLRVKELRKALNLTLEEFGKNIGITKTSVSRIENKVNNLSEQLLLLICKVYNVNEEWLRNGVGEIFVVTNDDIIDELSKKYDFDELDKEILKEYFKLKKEDRKIIKDYILNVVENFKNKKSQEEVEKEFIDKEVEAYRKELEASFKGTKRSSVLNTHSDYIEKEA